MSNNSLLSTLIEPVSPVTISMVPETIGWQIIALILCIYLLFIAVKIVKRFRRNRYRRAALNELRQLHVNLQFESINRSNSNDLQQLNGVLHKLNQILKHTAMVAYPNHLIAGLYGEDWLKFLSTTCDRVSFLSSHFRVWQAQLFKGNEREENNASCWTADDVSQVIEYAQVWVSHHKGEC